MLSHLCNFKSQESGHISFRRFCIFQPIYSSYFQDLGFGLGADVGSGPLKLLERSKCSVFSNERKPWRSGSKVELGCSQDQGTESGY